MSVLTVHDILSTVCDGFVDQCVNLVLIKFLNLWCVMFDCFICCQKVICMNRLIRYGQFAGEVEDIIATRLATVS